MNSKRAMSFESRVASNKGSSRRISRASRLAPRDSRRGILLLVVLSMLTLFLLIGTAFIVTSKQYQQTNKTRARLTETSNSSIDQQDLLNEVLNQLVRDTNNLNSSLRFHSLLRDMYGNDGFTAQLFDTAGASNTQDTVWASLDPFNTDPEIANPTNGQMIQFILEPTSVRDQFGVSINTLSQHERAYNGLVLTFIDGPARGQSVRIVGHTPVPISGTDAFNARLRVMTPRLADGSQLTNPALLDGSNITVNGRPFNGTGFGYNSLAPANSPRLGAPETDLFNVPRLVGLIPNSVFLNQNLEPPASWTDTQIAELGNSIVEQNQLTAAQVAALNLELDNANVTDQRQRNLAFFRLKQLVGTAGIGGADESYDAADFQNMLLGLLPNNPIETVLPTLDNLDLTNVLSDPQSLSSIQTPENMVLPSFHRPALLNYWRNERSGTDPGSSTLQDEANLLRKVLLRPNWIDHPNFDGSNPDFASATTRVNQLRRMIYGPWDVDNDLDGVRDSVWIDAGLPVMENHDGRLVKPLVAMLVVDMDGRLNLNAHGSEEFAKTDIPNIDQGGLPLDTSPPLLADDRAASGEIAGDAMSHVLPRGQGYGTAEISLNPLMPATSVAARSAWNGRFFEGVEARELPDALDARRELDDSLSPATLRDTNRFRRRTFGRYGNRPDPTLFAGANRSRPLPGVDDITVFDVAAQLKMQGVPRFADGNILNTSSLANPVRGNYATPPDFRGRYGLGINDFGQPVYEAIFDTPNFNTTLDSNTPYEVDLSLGASRGEITTAPDGPYSVAELERILRPYDSDAGALPARIWDFAGEFKTNPADTIPNLDRLNLWRTSVTTDSYDLPTPSVVVPEWMRLGPNRVEDAHVDPTDFSDDFEDVVGVSVGSATFADLLRYRMHLAMYPDNPANLPDRIARNIRVIHLPKLLPPDLANGLRLDLNRPLGNGRDDNNNGVVDEPGEWDDIVNGNADGVFDNDSDMESFSSEVEDPTDEFEAPYWLSTNNQIQNAGFTGNAGRFRDERILLEDRDNDGDVDIDDRAMIGVTGDINNANDAMIIDTHAELVAVHNMRRQLLARDLYVLAQTLAEPFPSKLASESDAEFERRIEVQSRQQARKLAQWAINVVDFRDPDNIMTAFEYDINPFDGWGRLPNGVRPGGIDGNPGTVEDIYGDDAKIDQLVGTTVPVTAANRDIGGLVWGAERPELLITETLGWHDRATENTNKEDPANDEDLDGFINDEDQGTVPLNANETTDLPDTDYDQRLRPRGAAFVELYCPWPENPAANGDTQAVGQITRRYDPTSQSFVNENDWNNDGVNDTVGVALGVNLAAVAPLSRGNPNDDTDTTPHFSPCWRLMMYKDGGPGLDPCSEQDRLRPRLPDRSVYFTDFDPDYPQPNRYSSPATAHPNRNDAERYVNDGVAFFRDTNVQLSAVQPGGYMVVGSGDNDGSGRFENKLTSPTGQLAYVNQGITLNPQTGLIRMEGATSGVAIPDPDGFSVEATNNVNVAIINQVDQGGVRERRFTFSEPANGYPRRVEGSVWNPTGGGVGRYEPAVDIPLDDQRALFDVKGFADVPLGTGGKLQANRMSELNDGETRLTLPGFRFGQGFNPGVQLGGGLGGQIEENSRTVPGFKWVYLQRLANPLLPWNPERFLPDGITESPGYDERLAVNPYMTIDSMGANVTVFTGVSEEERRVDRGNAQDPILRFRNRTPIYSFSSLQRGRMNSMLKPADPDGLLELQQYIAGRSDIKVNNTLNDAKAEEVQLNLWNPEPIGYINNDVSGMWRNEAGPARNGVGPAGTNFNFRGIPDHTLGFLNEPFRDNGVLDPSITRGDLIQPRSPLSSLTWHNRPFANAGELLQVPAYGCSNLLSAYSMRDDTTADTSPATELYDQLPATTQRRELWGNSRWKELLDLATDGSYGHLLNFFRADTPIGNGSSPDNWRTGGLYRVLDYVHVPSPFVASETFMAPASFGNDTVSNREDPRYLWQPPYNSVSNYREPGRINVNTVTSAHVWDGGVLHRELLNPNLSWDPVTNPYVPQWTQDRFASSPTNPLEYGHSGLPFASLQFANDRMFIPNSTTEYSMLATRRGYAQNSNLLLELDGQTPTFFENPFRAADAGDLVPLTQMMRDGLNRFRTPVESTLLRGEGTRQGRTFSVDSLVVADPSETNDSGQFISANRNSMFRYMPISRLSSMTTNRSNVYAVWITIGFFEVQPAPSLAEFRLESDPGNSLTDEQLQMLYDRVYPEGYQFGTEAGADTGDIRRVREFAMIDRTIPVAFEPGKNHNTEKAIRLRRRLE